VEMVLVRKPGLLSSLVDGLFACAVVVWKEFIGEPPLLTCDFGRTVPFNRTYAKLLRFNVFTPPQSAALFSVNACKRA